ncbi:hypothetical protein [Colwellia sp. MB02u-9]|uniref:hypothetical protein n=1 Tax=Colwellia sp. MB02u-9 TaxID=2759823 RepID=UPI0015F72E36|nr:hypothetical protein [Colwellia sp. MB02u-9]MBA6295645.1 hypothetical protein [Colwellia sp. MB02u-9]
MRKAEVASEDIYEAGRKLEQEGKQVSGYKLKNIIGKGRPERLMKEWSNRFINSEQPIEFSDFDIHVLEPEVEELLESLNEEIGKKLNEIIVTCDKKIQSIADRKLTKIRLELEKNANNLCASIDEMDELICFHELENERLSQKLDHIQALKLDHFEDEKTIIKLRARLQSKSELLEERQLRIDELCNLNSVLQETDKRTD